MSRDPRDIYYVCSECGRTAISFDKPFPGKCAECHVVARLSGEVEPEPKLTPELEEWLAQIVGESNA